MTALLVVALAVILIAGIVPAARGKASAASGELFGIHVVRSQHRGPRTIDYTLTTSALRGPVHVAVLLPVGYAEHRDRRYPVIYYLHGGDAGPNTGFEYLSWLADGHLQQITGSDRVISVMPEAGSGGWYTNWANDGRGGPPEWETFHVHQLVPFIDHTFRTIANRNARALIGLSMGGYGSMEYAARYPDLFGTAVAFSGAVDIADPPALVEGLAVPIIGVMASGDGGDPDSPFGSFGADEVNWRNHDPTDLAANLRNTHLFLYTGNGTPGPLDTPGTETAFAEGIEHIVYEATTVFAEKLRTLGIPVFVDSYGPGTHSWAYWRRDLTDVLPRVMHIFEHPSPAPGTISYTTADPAYEQWGWSVHVRRPAQEFSTLSNANAAGLRLAGSGSATVMTPAFYRPGTQHTVVLSGPRFSARRVVWADARGRIQIAVPLGPGNPYAEFSSAGPSSGSRVFTTAVKVH